MRSLLALVFLLGSCSATSCTRPPPGVAVFPTAGYEVAANATRKISVLTVDGGGSGTAWLYKKNAMFAWWVTAGHVCEPGAVMALKGPRGQAEMVIDVVLDNDEVDLCVVKTLTVADIPMTVTYEDPAYGEELHYVGSPLGMLDTNFAPAFKGIACGWSDGYLVACAPGYPGASGSAVADAQGNVVGVLVAVPRAWQELIYCVPIVELARLLKGVVLE